MHINALTAEVSLRVAPLVLDTLIKHYFERLKLAILNANPASRLRQEELLYDEAFNVVRVCRRFCCFSSQILSKDNLKGISACFDLARNSYL